MNKYLKLLFILILLVSAYHLIRDILQTFEIHNVFTNIAHRPHEWCGQYCNVITYPFDVAGIVISAIVLKRNKVGLLGGLLLVVIPVFVGFALLP